MWCFLESQDTRTEHNWGQKSKWEGRQILRVRILWITRDTTNIRNFSEARLSFLLCWFKLYTKKGWQKKRKKEALDVSQKQAFRDSAPPHPYSPPPDSAAPWGELVRLLYLTVSQKTKGRNSRRRGLPVPCSSLFPEGRNPDLIQSLPKTLASGQKYGSAEPLKLRHSAWATQRVSSGGRPGGASASCTSAYWKSVADTISAGWGPSPFPKAASALWG